MAGLTAALIECGAQDRVERQIAGNVAAACALVDEAGLAEDVALPLRRLAAAAAHRQE